MPVMATVPALEDHACGGAGSQQALPALVISDRTDVLVGKTVHHVLPGRAGIEAAEGAFAGSDENLALRGESHAVNAGDERSERRLLPTGSVVRRKEDIGASGGDNQSAVGLDRDEVTLAHHGTAGPGLALIGTDQQSSPGGRQPAPGRDFNVADTSIQDGANDNRGRLYCLRPLFALHHARRGLLGENGVDRTPLTGTAIKQKDAFVGARDQGAISRLL